ncbi:MAG: tetratricopeptide repeat-containing sulfotransferase family protein [Limisphaerales bacterium]
MNLSNKKLNEARALSQAGSFSQSVLLYEKLTRQAPHLAPLWFEYGCAAGSDGQMDLAERAWTKAVEVEPRNAQLRLQIGHQYQNLRQREKARASFEQAASLEPRGINPRMALAILFEQQHRFPEAREAIASCLAIDPRDDQARYFQAVIDRRENKLQDAERHLRDLIASGPRHQFVQYASHYELAEILDRTERFDEAITHLVEAKKKVQVLGDVGAMLNEYDQFAEMLRRTTLALPANILGTWSKEFPEKQREPIPGLAFLGGHPRSGTTLLEQILGAHPGVLALDESRAFTTIVAKMVQESPQVSPARLNVIRRRYIEALKKELGTDTNGKLILDKNPSPTAKLRIWLRVFPELKVVIALRDPRDVAMSCYFQNLPLNPFNANFLTLERTVRHYVNLMDVWLAVRKWEGLSWIETRYEDIVANLESEGRRVTDFLGLTWQEGQAQFYDKSRQKQIYSPTYHDASQPIYARSVSRWQFYEKHMASVLPILEPYCRALGYVK